MVVPLLPLLVALPAADCVNSQEHTQHLLTNTAQAHTNAHAHAHPDMHTHTHTHSLLVVTSTRMIAYTNVRILEG